MKLASSSSPWRFVATAVVVLLLVALNAHEALGAAGSPIIFGMSTPTNATANPAAQLGARFAYGIQLAFKEVNTVYGGVNGHPLQLLVQDDNYLLANTMANVANMIDNLGVFAIAGVIGAEQSQGAAHVCALKNTPLIGPYTGNYNLYVPFNRLFVNVRASYADEVNTLLSFLSNELRLTKVAAFYQNESIQVAGFSNLTLAFNLLGLKLVSQGVYDKNAAVTPATIDPAVQDVYANGTAEPEAIACIGTFAQIVLFIKLWRRLNATENCTQCLNTYFVMASFVGPELFSGFLQLQGVSPIRRDGSLAMYISQVVPFPNPTLSKPKMVAEYVATKLANPDGNTPSFTELEGYLVGRMIADTLFRMRSRDSATWGSSPNFDTSDSAARVTLRQLFLQTIYDVTNTFNIAGLTLGPFTDTTGDRCNQGMRQVYMVALASDYSYIPVPSGDFSFSDVCGSQTSDVARPLAFGQSADFSGDKAIVGNKVRAGIQAAFSGRNARQGGYNGRQLLLISYDDQGDSAQAAANVNTLVNENTVFGIMGSVGDETVSSVVDLVTDLGVPLVGPIAGSTDLRDPWRENVINIRGSVADETTLLVNYMSSSLKKFRVIALWSNDTTGANGFKALLNSLDFLGVNVIANASYDPATGNITDAFASLSATASSRNQVPEAIFLYATQTPIAQFILKAHASWPSATFFAPSSASAEGLSQTLAAAGVDTDVQLILSSVVPYPWDSSLPIVAQYLSDMQTYASQADIGFSSLEGYIEASFAEQVLDLLPTTGNQTGQAFVDAIYSRELFAFQGLRFGPFGNTVCTRNTLACKCNQGLHQTWMIKLNSSLGWDNLADTLVWTDCASTSTAIGVPLVFGQILPFTSQPNISNAITNGIYAAFGNLASANGQNLTLIPRDSDVASPATILDELAYSFGAFALVGLGSNAPRVAELAAQRGLPSIGSVSGSSAIREPYNRLYVNIRGSFADSAGAAISYLYGRGVQSVAVVYDSTLGDDPVDGVNRALANFSMTAGFTSFNPSSYNLQTMVNGAGDYPAVLLFGYENILAAFVELAKTQKASSTIYIAVGVTDPDYFNALVAASAVAAAASSPSGKRDVVVNNVYATSAVPPLSMTELPIVSDYLRDSQLYTTATPSAAGLEGYVAGRLIGEVFKRDDSPSRDSFLDTLYNFAVFNISSLRVGPYGAECSDSTCNCNQGMRQVWISQAGTTDGAENVPGSTYEFTSCGVSYPTDSSGSDTDVGAIVGGVVGGVVALLCCLAIIGAILFFLFVRNYRKREKQLAYALQNTPLSMLENSLVEMENEMAQMTPFDGENSILYQINDAMFPIQLDKTFLDFGVDSHKQCPINAVLTDVLMLENTGRDKVEFRFHHTLRNHKMSLLFTPNRGTIKPGKAKEIKVELVMKITTTINEPVVIEAVDQGHIVLNVKKEAELSTMLDYEEITINGPPIGVGGFGKVFRGHWRGAEVAVKVLRDQNPHIKELTQFKNEIEMVNKLRHKNIVNFIGAVTVPGKMCMVTEYIKLGSLQGAIHGHKKMSKLVKAKVALDVANGMNFLHQSGILHRDLKPDNVLIISLSGKADINAKLTDFGTSRAVGAGSEDFTFTKGLGTPIYMSPEILGHQDYTEKADVYSFAIMLWALVVGKEPYSDFKNSWDIARFVTAGKRLDVPKNAGALMIHLITACWAHNPDERPSFDEIVQELQSYVNVKKYGGDEASGDAVTEGDASSYGFGSRANESRGVSKNSGGKSSKNNTRNSRNTTRNTSSGGSGGPPSKNTSAFGFAKPSSRSTTKEGYAAGMPAPSATVDSSDDSSDDDVAGEKGKATLKSKLKKAGKNVTWDENNN